MNRVWKNHFGRKYREMEKAFHKYPELSFHEKKLRNLYMIHYAHFLL